MKFLLILLLVAMILTGTAYSSYKILKRLSPRDPEKKKKREWQDDD